MDQRIMTLGEFVDNFIEANSEVAINIIERHQDEWAHYDIKTLWRGMSWQCTQDQLNLDYMERRINENPNDVSWKYDFSPCPYRNETEFYIKVLKHEDPLDEGLIDIFLKMKD